MVGLPRPEKTKPRKGTLVGRKKAPSANYFAATELKQQKNRSHPEKHGRKSSHKRESKRWVCSGGASGGGVGFGVGGWALRVSLAMVATGYLSGRGIGSLAVFVPRGKDEVRRPPSTRGGTKRSKEVVVDTGCVTAQSSGPKRWGGARQQASRATTRDTTVSEPEEGDLPSPRWEDSLARANPARARPVALWEWGTSQRGSHPGRDLNSIHKDTRKQKKPTHIKTPKPKKTNAQPHTQKISKTENKHTFTERHKRVEGAKWPAVCRWCPTATGCGKRGDKRQKQEGSC